MPIGEDAIGGYTFKIEIAGQVIAQFKEVGGLEVSREKIEHREKNAMGRDVYKVLPGKVVFSDITLKRGVTDSDDLWKWQQKIMEGDVDGARTDGSIVLFDYAGLEKTRWNFKNAWPQKLAVTGMQAGSSDVLVEELTLAHEGIEKA